MGDSLPLTDGSDSARILERIQAFEDFGIHRTGWPADDATSQWLIDELAAAGVTSEAERFAFPRVEVRRAEVRVGSDRIEGVPLHDGGFTDQSNSGIECSRHNVTKSKRRWRTKRADDGRRYTIRPDGSIMLPVGVRPPMFPDDGSDDEHDDELGRIARAVVASLRAA